MRTLIVGAAMAAMCVGMQPAANQDQVDPQQIIQKFSAKEAEFREARNNYTYHQVNRVEELGAGNEVVGTFQQEWDILYEDNGKRIEMDVKAGDRCDARRRR